MPIPMQSLHCSARINAEGLPAPLADNASPERTTQPLIFMLNDGTTVTTDIARTDYQQVYQTLQRHAAQYHHVTVEIQGVLSLASRTLAEPAFKISLSSTSPFGGRS